MRIKEYVDVRKKYFLSLYDALSSIKYEHLIDKKIYKVFRLIHSGVFIVGNWYVSKNIRLGFKNREDGIYVEIYGEVTNDIEKEFGYQFIISLNILSLIMDEKSRFRFIMKLDNDIVMNVAMTIDDDKISEFEISEERMAITPDMENMLDNLLDKITETLEVHYKWKDILNTNYTSVYNTAVSMINTFIIPIDDDFIDNIKFDSRDDNGIKVINMMKNEEITFISYHAPYKDIYVRMGIYIKDNEILLGFEHFEDIEELRKSLFLPYFFIYNSSSILFSLNRNSDKVSLVSLRPDIWKLLRLDDEENDDNKFLIRMIKNFGILKGLNPNRKEI